MANWLPVVWAGLIAFAVLAYVLLDGFDLGVGILFAAEREAVDRDVMVNTIAPIWDGNETWLVLGGGGLLGVFPLAYAIILPALYPLIIAMLLSLVFRGVAFEFRFRAAQESTRRWWDRIFLGASALAGLCQGMALGGLLQGIKVVGRGYAGGWLDWLNGFTILCGIALVVGYALLGATWLIWRTEGGLQRRARRYAHVLGALLLALMVVVSLWTPTIDPAVTGKWFAYPGIVLTGPVPVLVALLAWRFWRGLARKEQLAPFLCVQGWFVLSYIGLGFSVWPLIVPPSITVWDAAAPPASQLFLLVGTLILLPIILCYTAYAHWVFRGKVRAGEHYH